MKNEFWILFEGNPEFDDICYKRYVSTEQMGVGLDHPRGIRNLIKEILK